MNTSKMLKWNYEKTCFLGVHVVDNESTNQQYYINSWGRVFQVQVVRDPSIGDGVYIYQNNIPYTSENHEWETHSTHHAIKDCLFTHKDKKIHAPITLFTDPQLALTHGNVKTIQEERHQEKLRLLEKENYEAKQKLLEMQENVTKAKIEAEEKKAKNDKAKGFMGLIATISSTIAAVVAFFKTVIA